MDQGPQDPHHHPVVITGLGHVIAAPDGPRGDAIREPSICDPKPYLKVKKNRKFMGMQDDLAVVAAGRALASAGLAGVALGERAGLYLVVGYIPFEREDMEELVAASVENDRFSMARSSTQGFDAINPLLTFRCLPNMPAYHISANFDLQGPYFVTYPGPGQFYVALEEARVALETGEVDVAIVGGVAHQRNFLVFHHFSRIDHPVAAARLLDAAGCLVLETQAHAGARSAPARGRLLNYQFAHRCHNPLETAFSPSETFETERGRDCGPSGEMGPASLPCVLSVEAAKETQRVTHCLESRDGILAKSQWELT